MTPLPDTTLSCCVCGATEAAPWRVGRDLLLGGDATFRAVRCLRCGTRRLDPRPPADDMARYYAPATYARAEGADSEVGKRLDAYSARLADKVRSVSNARNPGRALDVGCGDGRFLAALRARGWEVAGTETDPVAAELARGRTGATIYEDTLDALPGDAGPFDLVSLVHVLEHVPDPRATLADCLRLLHPGGKLLLALPNAASAEAALFGSAWYHLDLPRHLWGFTPRSLTRLLEETGFRVRDVAYTPFLFAPQSAINAARRGRAATAVSGAGEEPTTGLARREGGAAKTRVFLGLLRLSDRLGRAVPGEIMEVIATKPEGTAA
ncbi:MAG TPA: class I SAM-dependent methyltransferase [Armatimonadaceae bacterium]|nr:class I SAM-dependent methyltransferase [Armatimonadaceae bacterium]